MREFLHFTLHLYSHSAWNNSSGGVVGDCVCSAGGQFPAGASG